MRLWIRIAPAPQAILLKEGNHESMRRIEAARAAGSGRMWNTLMAMSSHSTVAIVAWVMLTAAALTGGAMVVLGMFEDLAGIVGAASRRSAERPRPAARRYPAKRAMPAPPLSPGQPRDARRR